MNNFLKYLFSLLNDMVDIESNESIEYIQDDSRDGEGKVGKEASGLGSLTSTVQVL